VLTLSQILNSVCKNTTQYHEYSLLFSFSVYSLLMSSAFDGTTHNKVFASLSLIATIVTSCCSGSILIMIKRLGVWNIHLSLVFAMTAFELLYDMFFFSCVVDSGSFGLTVLSNIAVVLGGLTSTLISNVSAAVALYVVYFKSIPNIAPYYNIIITLAMVPSLIVVIMYIMVLQSADYSYLVDIGILGIYFYTRLASIGINFFCSCGTAYIVYRMNSRTVSRTAEEIAITTLSQRLFYYPIVQAIGRSGCAWYEMQYSYNFNIDRTVNLNPPYTGDSEFAVQTLMVLCVMFLTISYLVIFLIMQPNASKQLTEFMQKWKLCQCIKLKYNPEEDDAVLRHRGKVSSVGGLGTGVTMLETTSNRMSQATSLADENIYDNDCETQSQYEYASQIGGSIATASRPASVDTMDSHFNNDRLFDSRY
jgi:hypothetical protein